MKDNPQPQDKVLENFMKEFFSFTELKKAGFFSKQMKGDYAAQAKKVCDFFGYETVYEYASKEIRCHLSYPRRLKVNEKGEINIDPFILITPSIF